jgi:hypothetical protein
MRRRTSLMSARIALTVVLTGGGLSPGGVRSASPDPTTWLGLPDEAQLAVDAGRLVSDDPGVPT